MRADRSLPMLFLFTVLGLLAAGCERALAGGDKTAGALSVEVKLNKVKARPGDRIQMAIAISSPRSLRRLKVSGGLFVPTKGLEKLELLAPRPVDKVRVVYQAEVPLAEGAAEGFYGITVEARLQSEKAVGKAAFLVGHAVGDFMIVSAVPEENQEQDLERYYGDFRSLGGNLVIIHNVISEKAWYPSRVCSRAARPGTPEDKVSEALRLARKYGFPALLSVSWDMTRSLPYSEYVESWDSVMGELWELYGSDPAFIGFYDYQEGSGTYFASQVREFAAAAKRRNRGLLTACAPYIDDPLLAGYLAAVDDLDVVIYQGAVMASYRPDNRRCFPLRRTRDLTALSAGATLAKNKITLSHVELFGYLEKSFAGAYLASPDDIRGQILSAATAFGPDGITLFCFHYNIHELGKKMAEAREAARGVVEGLEGYRLIAKSAASGSNHVGLYIPYSDWWADRWANCIVPASDAFRRLGVSAEIIPFIPPRGEEVLPYYPYHLNEEQLDYFLSHHYVLVLADVAGMQDTDSLLLKKFVEQGGVALLFGPQIPHGDLFKRDELCGGRENSPGPHSRIIIREPFEGGAVRAGRGTAYPLTGRPHGSWTPAGAVSAAVFEDGSGAVLRNGFGAGLAVTIPLSLQDAVEAMPEYLRDILDHGLGRAGEGRPFDVIGASEDMDFAMSSGDSENHLAIVNHGPQAAEVSVRPLGLAGDTEYRMIEVRTGALVRTHLGKGFAFVSVRIPGRDYVLLRLSKTR